MWIACTSSSKAQFFRRYPDAQQRYQKRYFTEFWVNDSQAKIIAMRYCINATGLLFKGFEAKFSSSTGETTQKYGTMDNAAADANNCKSFESVTEDVTQFGIYVDSNDVEGLHFVFQSGA